MFAIFLVGMGMILLNKILYIITTSPKSAKFLSVEREGMHYNAINWTEVLKGFIAGQSSPIV